MYWNSNTKVFMKKKIIERKEICEIRLVNERFVEIYILTHFEQQNIHERTEGVRSQDHREKSI